MIMLNKRKFWSLVVLSRLALLGNLAVRVTAMRLILSPEIDLKSQEISKNIISIMHVFDADHFFSNKEDMINGESQ